MKRERILITGVSGFVGRYVAHEALRRGYQVTGIDKVGSPATPEITFVEADIRDRDRMAAVVRGQDCVVHLAAITSNVEFTKSPLECYDINSGGFLNVIAAAAHAGCPRFVYASSAAVYLDNFSEDAIIDVQRQGNHYAKTKLMNEMVAMSYARITAMKTIGLRFFNVYGSGENSKGDYASIITLFLRARKNRRPIIVYGDGRQSRDLIHVHDAARITLDIVEKGTEDLYNVGTGASTTYSAIAETIDPQSITHVPNPLKDYQLYTRADTARLLRTIGSYTFVNLQKGITTLEV
jgi:UDP-glucose 4-epimerase